MKTFMFKKTYTLMAAVVAVLFFTSCDKKLHKEGNGVIISTERSVGSFTSLDADGKFVIRTHYSTNPHLVITTDDNLISEVQTFVQDGKLHLQMNDDYLTYDFTKLEVDVYTSTWTQMDLDGQVEIDVLDTIEGSVLVVNHYGRGNADILFHGDQLSLRVNGSADIVSSGTSASVSYYINGEGKISALNQLSTVADAHINGTGKIYVNCTDQLDATIDGNGDIYYTGSPSVTTEIHGTGSVQQY
ncbi:MAG: GIN domain-containing protein [Flavobacteriales bacterium]